MPFFLDAWFTSQKSVVLLYHFHEVAPGLSGCLHKGISGTQEAAGLSGFRPSPMTKKPQSGQAFVPVPALTG